MYVEVPTWVFMSRSFIPALQYNNTIFFIALHIFLGRTVALHTCIIIGFLTTCLYWIMDLYNFLARKHVVVLIKSLCITSDTRIFRRKNVEHSLILFIVIYISKFPDICFIRKTVSIFASVFSNYFSNVTFSHLRYGQKMACNLDNKSPSRK